MQTYLLEVSLCWAVFYLFYIAFLSRTTFFAANRWYLLFSLLAGLVIPEMKLPAEAPAMPSLPTAIIMAGGTTEGGAQTPIATVTTQSGSEAAAFPGWPDMLLVLYGLGVCIALLRFGYGLWQIFRLYRRSPKSRKEGYILVQTNEAHLPFSFFNLLFWSTSAPPTPKDQEVILRHETAHIGGRHSADVLLLEVLGVFFWFHPFVYLYRRALREVHEYLADDAALEITPRKKYGHLLFRQSQSGLQIALVNHLVQSQLKKRILMMTRKPSPRTGLLRYALLAPILVLTLLFFANRQLIGQTTKVELHFNDGRVETHTVEGRAEALNDYIKNLADYTDHIEQLTEIYVEGLKYGGDGATIRVEGVTQPVAVHTLPEAQDGMEIFKVVEQMPRFPGCEDIGDDMAEKKNCADKKMLEFVYRNIDYPEQAQKQGIEGIAVVRFVVNKDGSISNPEIVRSIGGGTDQEVLRVVNAMPRWVPGKQRGETVNVEFLLPVRFMLDEERQQEKPISNEVIAKGKPQTPPARAKVDGEEVFKVVEEMPRFPGCDEQTDSASEQKKCADRKMLEFIYSRIDYPAEARNAGIQGTAIVQFIVDKTGQIRNPQMIRSIGGGTDEAIIELVNQMPQWIPGKQRGRKVNVQFNLPIRFKLEDDKATGKTTDQDPPTPPTNLDRVSVFGYPDKQGDQPATSEDGRTLSLSDFRVAPNPTTGRLNLQFRADAKPTVVRITDLSGREVFRRDLDQFNGYENLNIQLDNQVKGMLLLSIRQTGKQFTKKVVVE